MFKSLKLYQGWNEQEAQQFWLEYLAENPGLAPQVEVKDATLGYGTSGTLPMPWEVKLR